MSSDVSRSNHWYTAGSSRGMKVLVWIFRSSPMCIFPAVIYLLHTFRPSIDNRHAARWNRLIKYIIIGEQNSILTSYLSCSQTRCTMSGAVPPPQPAQLPHILSLRVLRTTQPSLIDSVAAPYRESKTTNGITPTQGQSRQGESEAGMLLLPSTFGAIFLGSALSWYSTRSHD